MMVWLLVLACGDPDPCAAGSLLASPGALELSEQHSGWGEDACFQCHPIWTIHQANCTDNADIDVGSINDTIDVEDTESCVSCHGPNGIAQWTVTP